jgi:hypothetical protein
MVRGDSPILELNVPNPKDTDIHLVSYPKSGNTWMRYLLAYAIWPNVDEPDLRDMATLIPSFGLEHDAQVMLDPDASCNQLKHRVIKQHFAYGCEAKGLVKKAVYLCRDGRDAMVSYWHFCNQRDGTDISFSDFIRLSAMPDHSYGSWQSHVYGWINAPIDKLIVRYEDMHSDTKRELGRVLDFIEVERTDEEIEVAVFRASFRAMKRLEKNKGLNLDQLENVDFVRKGKIGSWKNVFSDYDIESFNRYHGEGVPELGYEW